MKKRLLTVSMVFAALALFACETDDTYEFYVVNNGTGDFYIDCWDEITIEGNYIPPGQTGTIILSGAARNFEWVRLCVDGDHCTQYAIGNYASFDVEVTPGNTINMSD